jgi:ABC-type multidrug transport system permease subunit
MIFNSFSFLVFFLIVTPLYYLVPHKWRWLFLLLISCYFYASLVRDCSPGSSAVT